METFLTFLDLNRVGINVLIGLIAFTILMIQWLAWIFRMGRFKKQEGHAGSSREKTAQFVFGEFLAKVISDFRNLLAVLIVLVFAFTLAYALIRSSTQAEMKDALQAVMATLGGLVGSIVGYYFGESAVKAGASGAAISAGQAPTQQPSGEKPAEEAIETAPAPPPHDVLG